MKLTKRELWLMAEAYRAGWDNGPLQEYCNIGDWLTSREYYGAQFIEDILLENAPEEEDD